MRRLACALLVLLLAACETTPPAPRITNPTAAQGSAFMLQQVGTATPPGVTLADYYDYIETQQRVDGLTYNCNDSERFTVQTHLEITERTGNSVKGQITFANSCGQHGTQPVQGRYDGQHFLMQWLSPTGDAAYQSVIGRYRITDGGRKLVFSDLGNQLEGVMRWVPGAVDGATSGGVKFSISHYNAVPLRAERKDELRRLADGYRTIAQARLADKAERDAADRREREAERQREAAAFQRALGTFKTTLEQNTRDTSGSRNNYAYNNTTRERATTSSSHQKLVADTAQAEQATRDRLAGKAPATSAGTARPQPAAATAPAPSAKNVRTTTASAKPSTAPAAAAPAPTPVALQRKEEPRPPVDNRPKLHAVPEAIMVCSKPSGPNGAFECRSPVTFDRGSLKEGRSTHQTPEKLVAYSTAGCPGARRLPSTTHLVWGCGFGATNNSNSMDRSAGVDVQGRRTYYCSDRQTSCRRTEP